MSTHATPHVLRSVQNETETINTFVQITLGFAESNWQVEENRRRSRDASHCIWPKAIKQNYSYYYYYGWWCCLWWHTETNLNILLYFGIIFISSGNVIKMLLCIPFRWCVCVSAFDSSSSIFFALLFNFHPDCCHFCSLLLRAQSPDTHAMHRNTHKTLGAAFNWIRMELWKRWFIQPIKMYNSRIDVNERTWMNAVTMER